MLCPHPESSYLIRVEGHSMKDAGIRSGDIVIVDKSNRNPTEKQVAVCEFNGEYTLKHFVMRDGVGFLVPANPDFPEIRVTAEDEFRIWGTVTYIIHKPSE
ncbi:MAG: LexA family transcriptional regulator, partial [Bacteroidaceae bacterium]|nr:LexA family transcriptional regulator [Bacteroidaceae bacterium]